MPRETVSFVLPSLDVSGDKEEGTSTVSWLVRRDWPGAHSCGRKIKKTRVKFLNLGTRNVRALLDNTKEDRPERRTAMVAKELSRYSVDIAALSEPRFADKGQLTECGGGYTFFWSGHCSTERREAGVGFAIKSHLTRNLSSFQRASTTG